MRESNFVPLSEEELRLELQSSTWGAEEILHIAETALHLYARLAEAERENERLREALREIGEYHGEPSASHAWDSAMRQMARAALAAEEPNE